MERKLYYDQQAIESQLTTRFTGRQLLVADELDSTNLYLKREAWSLPHGAAALAASQTSGRGSKGRSWNSPMGEGLYLSVLYRPEQPFDYSVMTPVAGLAVSRAIRKRTGLDVGVKWPNDPVVEGKKLCGILCESVFQGNRAALIIGMGINVETTREDFARRQLPHATSLAILGHGDVDREGLAADILQELESCYLSVCTTGRLGALRPELEKVCVTLDKQVKLVEQGRESVAFARSIDDQGHLVVEQQGQCRALLVSEVSVRGLYGYTE